MMTHRIYSLSLDLKKWVSEAQKMSSATYVLIDDAEKNVQVESPILKSNDMVQTFLNKLREAVIQELQPETDGGKSEIEFHDENFVRQKLVNYFRKIYGELKGGKKGKYHRKVQSTHLDIYDESTDLSTLPKHVQFYVVLQWCKKYYNREEYKKAVDPLRRLIKLNPQFGLGYKWLARSLKKIRKYDEAMKYYEKYAEVDGSVDSLLDLAKSFRKGKIFDKSEEVYHQISEKEPKNKEARIGMAQIRYAIKQPGYLDILDGLHEEDPNWLKGWLVDEFNFRIYVPEKTLISPKQAANLLGFDEVFKLTQRAFKNELPSHFNPAKARLSFYKEELENWAEAMNRYQCFEKPIELHPKGLDVKEAEIEKEEPAKKETPKKSDKPVSTRVEDILKEIRARKAQRAAQAKQENNPDFPEDGEKHKSNGSNGSRRDESNEKQSHSEKGKRQGRRKTSKKTEKSNA